MSAGGASNGRAAETGPAAALVTPAQPVQRAPLDIRVALAAHLAGLALPMAAIVGFTVLMGQSLHWLTG
ncbi:hypothetical protein [Paraburkholderia madseniana]|uniref:hypothetical protein n=1 Tax=Paraburkholderia TaxID=1822464 RepID=UPI0015C53C6D|nr:hypothetical protein [Paraburkholderia madseniana]